MTLQETKISTPIVVRIDVDMETASTGNCGVGFVNSGWACHSEFSSRLVPRFHVYTMSSNVQRQSAASICLVSI
jgi:hypothetical protein